ncbi:hypothetical protein ZWY2020_021529 [Hordeum vulgare]|nr:hypothetical protein ZWY2020_021529 [Hordeum vulgare]
MDHTRMWLDTFPTPKLATRAYDSITCQYGRPRSEMNFSDIKTVVDATTVALGFRVVPVSVGGPDYEGLELDLMVFCEKHGKASKRHVAFEGTDTGRRFLACAEPNLKLKHMKYKQVHSEAMMKLELTNEEVTYYEEKLTQEKLELKF